jgi:hypothetical protein
MKGRVKLFNKLNVLLVLGECLTALLLGLLQFLAGIADLCTNEETSSLITVSGQHWVVSVSKTLEYWVVHGSSWILLARTGPGSYKGPVREVVFVKLPSTTKYYHTKSTMSGFSETEALQVLIMPTEGHDSHQDWITLIWGGWYIPAGQSELDSLRMRVGTSSITEFY